MLLPAVSVCRPVYSGVTWEMAFREVNAGNGVKDEIGVNAGARRWVRRPHKPSFP